MLQVKEERWDPQEHMVTFIPKHLLECFLDKHTISLSYFVTVQFWMWDSSKPVGQSFQKIQTWIENTF